MSKMRSSAARSSGPAARRQLPMRWPASANTSTTAVSCSRPSTRALPTWAANCMSAAAFREPFCPRNDPPARCMSFRSKDPAEVRKMLDLFGHTGREPALRIRPECFVCRDCVSLFSVHGVFVLRHRHRPGKGLYPGIPLHAVPCVRASWRPFCRSMISAPTAR